MKWHLIVLIGLFVSFGGISAEKGKVQAKSGGEIGKNPLVGRWVSKSINGDALFFIVSQLEGRVDANGNFKGTVTYTDYQTSSITGTYKDKGDHVLIYTKGTRKPYKLLYKFKDPEKKIIIVTDEEFGVSIRLNKLKKGQKTPSDSLF